MKLIEWDILEMKLIPLLTLPSWDWWFNPEYAQATKVLNTKKNVDLGIKGVGSVK
jgi:hypothetical protein